jgi:imidazole glycerol-phosphate synthase subunit HisH
VEHAGELRLFDGIPSGAHFYFVHSFYPVVAGAVSTVLTEGGLRQARVAPDARSGASDAPHLRVAWCEYGVRFAAAIEVGRIHATQFHPEKSQRWGLRMLENFAAVVKSGR